MWQGRRKLYGDAPLPTPTLGHFTPRAAKKKVPPIVKWVEGLAKEAAKADTGLYLFCLDECDEFVALTRSEYAALAENTMEGALMVEMCRIEEPNAAWVRAWVEKNQPKRAGYLMPFRAARRKKNA